jgi:hypothetical protein
MGQLGSTCTAPHQCDARGAPYVGLSFPGVRLFTWMDLLAVIN